MRGTVAFGVSVVIFPRDHAIQDFFHIGGHVWIGIFIDRDTSGCMGNKEGENAVYEILFMDMLTDECVHVNEVSSGFCLDAKSLHSFYHSYFYLDLKLKVFRASKKDDKALRIGGK